MVYFQKKNKKNFITGGGEGGQDPIWNFQYFFLNPFLMNFTKIKNGFLKCFFCDLECAAIQAKRSPIPLGLKLEKS